MTGPACLTDEELTTTAATHLAHLEDCDECRTIWLHARDTDDAAWTVGRYQVRGALGAGGLGVVLLGWDPALQREVAIKFPAARGDTLLGEAQALAAIRHRNVVAVHDFGEVDGDVYFAMERVDGVPFDTWWLGASTSDRVRALLDVAAGLGAIHAAGLVHCDIKPGNIIVTRAGDAVIVDLGLATSHGVLAGGTPGFRAPEEEASVAADEYAFWRVVQQCLAGAELSAKQRRKLDAAVARGTSVDPAQRFGSMDACARELRAVFARSRAVVVGAAAAAVALGATAFAATRGDDCDSELPGWSGEHRTRVAKHVAPAIAGRIAQFVERERAAGSALLERTCKADDVAALRTRSCVRSGWQWIAGHVEAIAAGRDAQHSLDELPLGVPMAGCGGVTASPPVVNAHATAESRRLSRAMFALAGAPPAEKIERLVVLGDAVRKTDNAGLLSSWHLELADAYQRAGKEREALASALAATDVATRNGDDILLARARLHVYILRDAVDRASPTRDEEVEAIVVRAGSPGLLAMFHNAAGQRAIASGDIERARALLRRSIDALVALELAPSMMRGSGEQNLGVALQFSRDLDGAQVHLDRAVEIFTARFGAADDVTAGARLAAATNTMYRGKVEDGARALDALANELAASKQTETAVGARVAMARCQAAQAQKQSPLERCKEALATNRAVFGDGHVELVPPLLATAQMTMATSVRDAVPLLEEAIAIAEKQANNPTDLPYARGLYALALKVTGRVDDGKAIAKLALPELDRLGQKELAAALRQHFSL